MTPLPMVICDLCEVICSATPRVNPPAAPRSNLVCARILAQKLTHLPTARG
jgi:hypothetical protein